MILTHKTVLFLGSSVTYGAASCGVSFADMMAETCGLRMVKEAVSGTPLTDTGAMSYVSRLKAVDRTLPIDLMICQLSTNDVWQKLPMDGIEDAIRWIIAYTRETWGCPIVFYTSPRFDSEEYGHMVELLLALKAELGFSVLDLWNAPDLRETDPEAYACYMPDPIHPNERGYREWWTPLFIAFCEAL